MDMLRARLLDNLKQIHERADVLPQHVNDLELCEKLTEIKLLIKDLTECVMASIR